MSVPEGSTSYALPSTQLSFSFLRGFLFSSFLRFDVFCFLVGVTRWYGMKLQAT